MLSFFHGSLCKAHFHVFLTFPPLQKKINNENIFWHLQCNLRPKTMKNETFFDIYTVFSYSVFWKNNFFHHQNDEKYGFSFYFSKILANSKNVGESTPLTFDSLRRDSSPVTSRLVEGQTASRQLPILLGKTIESKNLKQTKNFNPFFDVQPTTRLSTKFFSIQLRGNHWFCEKNCNSLGNDWIKKINKKKICDVVFDVQSHWYI